MINPSPSWGGSGGGRFSEGRPSLARISLSDGATASGLTPKDVWVGFIFKTACHQDHSWTTLHNLQFPVPEAQPE
jgi:hypothetical protein